MYNSIVPSVVVSFNSIVIVAMSSFATLGAVIVMDMSLFVSVRMPVDVASLNSSLHHESPCSTNSTN
jgi:hypothetical protein